MSGKKMKLCANCDGLVALEVIICPYCGNDVLEAEETQINTKKKPYCKKKLTEEETLSSLYPSAGNSIDKNTQSYMSENEPIEEPNIDSSEDMEISQDEVLVKEPKKTKKNNVAYIFSILFFSLGINIALFGICLFIFATNGELFLKWNAKFWYLYLLFGMPLAFLGYQMISKKFNNS